MSLCRQPLGIFCFETVHTGFWKLSYEQRDGKMLSIVASTSILHCSQFAIGKLNRFRGLEIRGSTIGWLSKETWC